MSMSTITHRVELDREIHTYEGYQSSSMSISVDMSTHMRSPMLKTVVCEYMYAQCCPR